MRERYILVAAIAIVIRAGAWNIYFFKGVRNLLRLYQQRHTRFIGSDIVDPIEFNQHSSLIGCREGKCTIYIQDNEYLWHEIAISMDEIPKQDVQKLQTYCRRDFGYGGKQQPDDALRNRHRIRRSVSITAENRYNRTCFQSRRPKPNIPLSKRRRNKPTSIMRSNIMSAMVLERIVGLLLSVLGTSQVSSAGAHTERSYRKMSLRRSDSRNKNNHLHGT